MLSKQQIEFIFKNHYKDLLNYAYTFTGNLHYAEEIVQEVFLAIWEKKESIQINSSLKNYLMGMVRHKALNLKTRYLNKNNLFEDLEQIPTQTEIQSDIPGKDLNKIIRRHIRNLPEQCRTIFLLSRFTSLTYAEIANHLSISVKTVETQISIALKRLKDGLNNHSGSDK